MLIDAVRDNFTTIFVALNATIGGNVSVHTTITDLVSSNAEVTVNPSVTPSGEAAAAGVFTLSVNHGQPWVAVLYSKARGPRVTPSAAAASPALLRSSEQRGQAVLCWPCR